MRESDDANEGRRRMRRETRTVVCAQCKSQRLRLHRYAKLFPNKEVHDARYSRDFGISTRQMRRLQLRQDDLPILTTKLHPNQVTLQQTRESSSPQSFQKFERVPISLPQTRECCSCQKCGDDAGRLSHFDICHAMSTEQSPILTRFG